MNIAVTYYSRTRNTKKIAEAIAEAAGCTAQDIAAFDAQDTVVLLFVGGAIYGGVIDPSLTEFIAQLDPAKIKRAAVFGTSVSEQGFGKANGQIKDALRSRGISTEDEDFTAKGKFLFMSRKRPNAADMNEAKEFAAHIINKNLG